MKNSIAENKNALEGLNSKPSDTEKCMGHLDIV